MNAKPLALKCGNTVLERFSCQPFHLAKKLCEVSHLTRAAKHWLGDLPAVMPKDRQALAGLFISLPKNWHCFATIERY
ncbi:hypothetical protein [Pseudomonas sp. EL_65y_Pfl2_R95]|uniref:hypothetical protein n=1 Tax=Pseudomonas sp. EL_65y_Pfl2_R95 TaxID=3088698 RepID=UPI0030DC26E3